VLSARATVIDEEEGWLTPRAFSHRAALVQDTVLVRGDELEAAAETVAFALLTADGAGLTLVGKDIGQLATDGDWSVLVAVDDSVRT